MSEWHTGWKEGYASARSEAQTKCEMIYDELLEAKGEIARMRAALKPFANMGKHIVEGTPDEAICSDVEFTAGELRNAAAALKNKYSLP